MILALFILTAILIGGIASYATGGNGLEWMANQHMLGTASTIAIGMVAVTVFPDTEELGPKSSEKYWTKEWLSQLAWALTVWMALRGVGVYLAMLPFDPAMAKVVAAAFMPTDPIGALIALKVFGNPGRLFALFWLVFFESTSNDGLGALFFELAHGQGSLAILLSLVATVLAACLLAWLIAGFRRQIRSGGDVPINLMATLEGAGVLVLISASVTLASLFHLQPISLTVMAALLANHWSPTGHSFVPHTHHSVVEKRLHFFYLAWGYLGLSGIVAFATFSIPWIYAVQGEWDILTPSLAIVVSLMITRTIATTIFKLNLHPGEAAVADTSGWMAVGVPFALALAVGASGHIHLAAIMLLADGFTWPSILPTLFAIKIAERKGAQHLKR